MSAGAKTMLGIAVVVMLAVATVCASVALVLARQNLAEETERMNAAHDERVTLQVGYAMATILREIANATQGRADYESEAKVAKCREVFESVQYKIDETSGAM